MTIKDITLTLDPEVMSPTIVEVLEAGTYESAEAREIARIVQPGEPDRRTGSGLGYIAFTALKTGKVAARRLRGQPAVDPDIRKNASLNGLEFEVVNAVVDPKYEGGTVPFYLRRTSGPRRFPP